VDDEGYGYRDHGGEIWEVDEEEGENGGKAKNAKKRKLDVSVSFVLNKLCSLMNSISLTS